MSTFTVTQVQDKHRDWEGKNDSKWTSHYVKVEGDERIFEVVRKRDAHGPKAGDQIDATIETREHNGTTYYKLKSENKGFGGGGRGKSPEERRSIARQHAQKAAMSYAAIKGEKGDLPADFKVNDLKPIIDWLFNDVMSVEGQS